MDIIFILFFLCIKIRKNSEVKINCQYWLILMFDLFLPQQVFYQTAWYHLQISCCCYSFLFIFSPFARFWERILIVRYFHKRPITLICIFFETLLSSYIQPWIGATKTHQQLEVRLGVSERTCCLDTFQQSPVSPKLQKPSQLLLDFF